MKMVTYFNRKDLVKFGNYLLSEERTNLVTQHEGMTKEMQQEALKQVSHADISNWLDSLIEKEE